MHSRKVIEVICRNIFESRLKKNISVILNPEYFFYSNKELKYVINPIID